jgi:hypothetical protein
VKINGMPGVVTWHADEVSRVLATDSKGDKITAVYVVSNPEKLILREAPGRLG